MRIQLLIGLLIAAGSSCVSERLPCPVAPALPSTLPASAGVAASSGSCNPHTSASHPDRDERLELFHGLVAAARKYHVFSSQTEQNLGRRWKDDLPVVEREFVDADTMEELTTALFHFQNSLHNGHCSYEPILDLQRWFAGFTAGVEWVEGMPVFYVEDVSDSALKTRLSAGDTIVSMDGIPAGEFLTKFSLESNSNSPRGVAEDIARFLGMRMGLARSAEPPATTSWQLQKRANGEVVEVQTTWTTQSSTRGRSAKSGPNYETVSCGDLPDRDYGPYKLRDLGANYCLYTSDAPPFNAYPVVRHFSFDYSGGRGRFTSHLLRAEQHSLKARLGAISTAKGVILDLRDNRGGNNPNWFFDWYAPAPYYDHFVAIRLHADFATEQRLREAEVTGWGSREIAAYLQALQKRKPGEEFMPRRPFFCRSDTCDWDNHYVPTHQVTKLPLALLVGPDCVSACDEFAQVFSENGFGPLIGEQPASAFTAYRIRHPVKTPRSNLDLGSIGFAFSNDFSGKTGEEVEARPLRIDYPVERTFATRPRYDAILIQTSVKAFREFRFPKPSK